MFLPSLLWLSSSSASTSPYYSSFSFSAMIPLALFYSIVSQHWMKGRLPPIRSLPPLADDNDENEEEKIAIITGCNTGIGYETARTLIVRYHYTVIFACRDEQKAQAAIATIGGSNNSLHNKKAVFIAPLDLASFQSVHDFCTAVGEKYNGQKKKKIQLLINNAGRNTSGISTDDLDLQFQTNFLGHFLLTKLLIEQGLMDVSSSSQKKARIVNLASVMHHFCGHSSTMGTVEFWKRTAAVKQNVRMVYGMPVDDPITKSNHVGNNNTYSVSKLAAILFTNELNRRYPQLVTAVTANPGAVNSDIWRSLPPFVQRLLAMVCLSTEQGSHTSIVAATAPDDNKMAGQYLQPYWLPQRYTTMGKTVDGVVTSPPPPFPVLEMFGPFVGCQPTTPRLPADAAVAGQAMWTASEEILAEWAKKQE